MVLITWNIALSFVLPCNDASVSLVIVLDSANAEILGISSAIDQLSTGALYKAGIIILIIMN